MTERWEQILERYGQTVTVYPADGGAGAQCRAFLQPVREQGADFFQRQPTPLGLARKDRWICLGGPELALDQVGRGYLAWGEVSFTVRSAQPVYLGEKLVYWWGLLAVRDQDV